MQSRYLELSLLQIPDEYKEILIAELQLIDYEYFWEDADCLKAYIEADKYQALAIDELLSRYGLEGIERLAAEQNQENWNEKWESSFHPIDVEGIVYIRASFHEPKEEFKYQIEIEPKMSFGTGHHATTYMMIQQMLTIPVLNCKVLDYGCGTGILAIMANKLFANEVVAIDIDSICIENSEENFARNNVGYIKLIEGNITSVTDFDYQIILANITRNIIIENLSEISRRILFGGYLICSGFYKEDVQKIKLEAEKNGFMMHTVLDRDNWASICFIKEEKLQ